MGTDPTRVTCYCGKQVVAVHPACGRRHDREAGREAAPARGIAAMTQQQRDAILRRISTKA